MGDRTSESETNMFAHVNKNLLIAMIAVAAVSASFTSSYDDVDALFAPMPGGDTPVTEFEEAVEDAPITIALKTIGVTLESDEEEAIVKSIKKDGEHTFNVPQELIGTKWYTGGRLNKGVLRIDSKGKFICWPTGCVRAKCARNTGVNRSTARASYRRVQKLKGCHMVERKVKIDDYNKAVAKAKELKSKEVAMKRKEKADKEAKRREKADKEEKKSKELTRKEQAAKESAAKAAKEKAQKEVDAKEKKKKETAQKEKTSKEITAKEIAEKKKEKADKAAKKKEKADKEEKKSKELSKKEAAAKEKIDKEKTAKESAAKEKTKKEKAAKEAADKEKASKEEKKSKELKSKESAAKAKERKDKEDAKEKKSKADESRAKELSQKEKAQKEKQAKESAAKEKTSKESSHKERTRKGHLKVSRHWWHGWINNWDGNMGWHVGGTTFVSGLHSTHSNHKEDRLFKPLLTTIGTSQRSHHWSGYINAWDKYFAYSCPSNMAIIGFKSYHSNHREDRRWNILCSSFNHVNIAKSGWPHWQTNWDATWSIGCGHRPLVGLSSYHDNGKEDRRWRVQCGTVTNRL